ncbi:MAG: TolC family protein [Desulfobulbaceae bacterium]|nr:MAG: TolC family protein [Desulfobulbaceae bacterium]
MSVLSVVRRQFLLVVVALAVLPLSAYSSDAPAELSLEAAIELALKNNPRVEIATEQEAALQGTLTTSKSSFLPRLTAGANYGRINIDGLAPVEEDNFLQGLLRISQLIWDFGRSTGVIDSAEFSRAAAWENLTQTKHDIVFETKTNFYSVLEKQRLITVAEQAVKNYETQLYRAQKYYEAGVRTKIDVTNAQVNLSNQKLGLLRAQSNLKAARVLFENTLGTIPHEGNYTLLSDEDSLETLADNKPQMMQELEELIGLAKENRPGLKRYTFLVQAAESVVNNAEGDYWPTISAVGDYNVYETDISSLADQWQISVGLSWEFFSGFETEGKVAEANAKLRETRAGLREFELVIDRDVTDSFLRAEENSAAVDIADQSLSLAKENLDLADGRYKAGIGDILEYNDAQLLYTENQSNLVITYYTYLTALARIERAIGIIPELPPAE